MSPQAATQTIPDHFRATARRWARALVVVGCGRDLRYDELDTDSDGVAGSLAAAGIQAGERIALYCPNGTEFVIAYLGILKAGACVVPVNLMLNPLEVGFILRDAGARGLFYHASLAGSATKALGEAPGVGLRVSIGAGADASDGAADLNALAGSGLAAPVLDLDPSEAVAAILYTSGTTGRPKGAMLSHANLSANTAAVMQALDLTPVRDRILVVLPMFHAFAATVGMLMPLLHGLSLIPVLRFDPRQVSATIADHGATVFLGVPSMYALLLRMDEAAVAQWRGVRLCVCGGAAMPQAVMAGFEARFGIPLLEGDGPTECSPVTCVNPVAGPRKPGSVGPAIPGVAMRIAGPDGGTLPDGEHGEVCVRGPNVMRGYWGLPEETRRQLLRRLVPHRRSRLARRRRVHLPGGPHQGPDHHQRHERLPADDRGGPLPAPGPGGGGRGRRASPTARGAAHRLCGRQTRGQAGPGGPTRLVSRAPGASRGPAAHHGM